MDATLKIRVGSTNPVKVEAVKEYFADAEVVAMSVDSGIGEQPKSLEETFCGARNRAERCKGDADWGIGIESGIMPLSEKLMEWLNIVTCSIWDGQRHCMGMGSGFIVPPFFTGLVLTEDIDLSEAAFRAGFTKKKRIGYEEGIVSILTDGKMARKPYIKQAIMMAMIPLSHPEHYMLAE